MPEGADAAPDSLGPLMDAQVPAVVAVVVTTDPGPWLEEALSSLAAQDYEELSVLVLSTGDDDPTGDRAGRPGPPGRLRPPPAGAARLRRGVQRGPGHGGGGGLLPALPRRRARWIPTPSTSWSRSRSAPTPAWCPRSSSTGTTPRVLLHVGMSCDKTGAVVDRILEGEVDHGQHDAVRDVFVAPGGCILVRADLFAELEGLRRRHRRHGRGPRPVLAQPGGRLPRRRRTRRAGAPPRGRRRRARAAGGRRPRPTAATPSPCRCCSGATSCGPCSSATPGSTSCGCCRRRRCWPSARSSWPCWPATATGSGPSTGAWRWNARRLTELSVLRGELAEHRLFPDAEVRRLQVRGSARLSRYFSRLSHQGLEAANAVAASRERPRARRTSAAEVAVLTGSVGSAFSEDADFDELDDLGRRAGRDRFGRRVRSAPLSTGRQRVVALVVALLVDRHRDPRPLLRDPAARGPAGAAAVVVDQLAPLLLGLAVGRGGHHGAGLARLRPRRPHRHRALRRHGHAAAGPAPRLHPPRRLGRVALHAPARARRGPAWSRSSATSGSRCPTARWARAAGTVWWPTPPSPSSRCAWPGPPASAPYAVEPGTALAQPPRRARSPSSAPSSPPRRPSRRRSCPWCSSWRWPGCWARSWSGAREPAGRVLVVAVRGGVRGAGAGRCPGWSGRCWPARARWRSSGCPLSGATAPSWGEVIRFAVGPAARSPVAVAAGASARRCPLVIGRGIRLAWAARLWVTGAGVVGPRLRRHARRPGLVHALGVGGAGPGRARRRRRASASGSPPSRTT